MAKPIQKIGFFHFGRTEKGDPITSLRNALLSKEVRNSLIVIPEAFNLRRGYYDANRQTDSGISGCLAQMSTEFGIAFVAGIVEPSRASAAYLIDGRIQKLLSWKMEDDRSCNYQPASVCCDAVIRHRGLCLGALICMDACIHTVTPTERHQKLLSQFKAAKPTPTILCIPAHMGTFSSKAVVEAWPSEIDTILGNSSASNPSVMRIAGRIISTEPCESALDVIRLTDISNVQQLEPTK